MENSNFQGSGDCGEDIERALMDLGPLLGVTIKEEAPDELTESSAASTSRSNNVGEGPSGVGEAGKAEGEGADSLASPASRAPFSALRCVLCQHPLAHAEGTPKLMECLHSACEPCVKAKIEEKLAGSRDFLGAGRVTITCPACRLQCQPANMIDQRFVLEKVALEQAGTNGTASNDQQCNSCDDTEPATSYCVDCAEYICDNCVSAHQRLKITKDHTIKSREEAVSELQAAQGHARAAHDMFCRDHVQERLTLFCETCDRLTCRDCQLQHHRDHKYQFSTEMAAQARANISSLLSEVSYKRVLLGSAMKVIRDRQQLIADKKKALVHEITQTVVKLTNAINTRGKQLVLRLNEVCDGKQRTLSEKKDALEQLAAITDHCVEFVNSALDQGSDTAVLYSKRAVCAHLQRIKSRRADIPNPEIPVRISLALDKLPDLVRVLSTIGAIVVDGKVDGGGASPSGGSGGSGSGGGSAQGPYHPPAAPPHSAVVALQQVAMHQSYVQAAVSGAVTAASAASAASAAQAGQYLALQRARSLPAHNAHNAHAHHTPLRHPHVTSTTHPHHLHGMSEMNLRGLLNATGGAGAGGGGGGGGSQRARAPAALPAQAAMHHAYQQMIGAYANNALNAAAAAAAGSGRRSVGPRTPSPAPPPHFAHLPALHAPPAQHTPHAALAAPPPPAKWHIPQHSLSNGGAEGGAEGAAEGGADFKITLGRQHAHHAPRAPVVTSTNPKTPSPSLNGGASLELDKVCAESVQDLMATIAKLDSNGVQVVAEAAAPRSPAPSPALVHSTSTAADERATRLALGKAAAGGAAGAGDPNEDWCAVCMDGGELMCCDKCPKVFHQYCHIPTIEKLPDETESWQCLLCVNFAELPPEPEGAGGAAGGGLSPRQQRLVERLTLELYCQYEPSLPFREPVPAENHHYHSKIARPMCLDMIRMKLQPRAPARYTHVAQFVADVRLLFRNAYRYNPSDSQIYKDAKRLEEFFEAQLLKWLPEYAYWSGEGEPPVKRARAD